MIDTHAHLEGKEFSKDIDDVLLRAKSVGIEHILLPSVTLESVDEIRNLCRRHPDCLHPMIGLHPEEVRADYKDVLARMYEMIDSSFVAIGEVGLDYYWSREFEKEQQDAFETQIQWSIEHRLPLMLHLRKAQNEAVKLMRRYRKELTHGGVFHCFSGNEQEARELLDFDGFALGIGGILTFKKSNLPDTLRNAVPLERIVLETDAPYLAPVPMRGKRNESSFVPYVVAKLAETYGVDEKTVAEVTTATAMRIFF